MILQAWMTQGCRTASAPCSTEPSNSLPVGSFQTNPAPWEDAFHSYNTDKSLFSWLDFLSRAGAVAPMVYLGRGLIHGYLLPNAVNKIGTSDLAGKDSILGNRHRTRWSNAHNCFPLQIRLEEIKAAAGEPFGIRRMLEVDTILIQNIMETAFFMKTAGKFN